MLFRQIYDRRLSQYSYLIGCQATGEAIVIDPMRNIDRYLSAAAAEGVRLVGAAETHIHADFLSGARELAERTGGSVYLSNEGGPDWQYQWGDGEPYSRQLLGDGDTFHVGNIRFDVMHTPGHTPEHISFLVTDHQSRNAMGILSGDFVFVGDVGRPDLLESAAGVMGAMEPSARTLYQSIERFRRLAPELQVWPGHGAGSACGKALGAVPTSTVGYELAVNASILAATEEGAFVSYILDGQPEPPLYFARMKRLNKEGPPVLGKLPEPRRVRDGKLAELSGATGVAVCDTRSWDDYRRSHLPGSLHVPLNTRFNTTAGSFVRGEMPVYLIVDEARVSEAVVDLIHIGLDNIVGYATPEMFAEHRGNGGKTATCGQVEAADFFKRPPEDAFLLDVRGAGEVAGTGVIPGACHIVHTRLLERIDEVPRDRSIVVYCESGSRSAYAAGLLDRHDRTVAHMAGGLVAWQDAGGEPMPLPG